MSTILSRWRARLTIRQRLAAAARKRFIWHPTAANRATLKKRREQIAFAERVVDRHTSVTGMSPAGVELVARFEGFRSRPYRDAVGVWTIGYGETKGVGPNTPPMTQSAARELLRVRLNRDYLPPVLAAAKAGGLQLAQNELDALVSLSYNLGGGVFSSGHTIGDALRSGSRARVAASFLIYDRAGGNVLPGLTRRRQAERALFLKG